MRKTRIIIGGLLLSSTTIFVSCNQDRLEDKSMNESLIATSNQKAKSIHSARLANIKGGKYNFDGVDMNMIEKGMPQCKSEADVITLWEKAGMKNAKEYFTSIKSQMGEYKKAFSNPETKEWTDDVKKNYIKKSISSNSIR